jgi:hypothetical protein
MSDVIRPRHSECPAYRIGTASAARPGEAPRESATPVEVSDDRDGVAVLATR